MYDVKELTDKDVIARLGQFVREEHSAMLQVLVSLSELDKRKLFLGAGFSSTFAYCTEQLRYSEAAAMRRIKAARTIRAFHEVFRLLRERRVSLSSICLFAPVLTAENEKEVLDAVSGKSCREVEKIVSGYGAARAKDVPDRITPLKVSKTASSIAHSPAVVMPLFSAKKSLPKEAETRMKLAFSVSSEVAEKLEYARRLLSGKYPEGVRLEAVLDEALESLLDSKCPQRRDARRVKRKTKAKPKKTSSIPAVVRDAVYARDKHQCSFQGVEGKRCSARWDLELDHIVPRALGGTNEIENLRVLCRAHNLHEAKRILGKEYVEARYRCSA